MRGGGFPAGTRRAVLFAAVATPALAQGLPAEAWRDPHCGCCAGWVEHLRAEGFTVADHVVPSVAPFRRMLGTPANLLSCHAGRVAGLALEGHVPAHAIRQALSRAPGTIAGLAVPEMPIGTPGMEVPGREADIYTVIGWRPGGAQFAFLRMRGAAPV